MIITRSEYEDFVGENIKPIIFKKAIAQIETELNSLTNGRYKQLKNLEDYPELKTAIMIYINELSKKETASNISSERLGDWSVNYIDEGAKAIENCNNATNQLKNILNGIYINGKPLTYRGIDYV